MLSFKVMNLPRLNALITTSKSNDYGRFFEMNCFQVRFFCHKYWFNWALSFVSPLSRWGLYVIVIMQTWGSTKWCGWTCHIKSSVSSSYFSRDLKQLIIITTVAGWLLNNLCNTPSGGQDFPERFPYTEKSRECFKTQKYLSSVWRKREE